MIRIRLPRFSKRPMIRRLILVGTVLCTAWLLVSSAVAYRLTRRHDPGSTNRRGAPAGSDWRATASRLAMEREIGAWFVDGRDDAPSVLVLHGHKGQRRNSLGRAEILAKQGYPVMMITHRAHGDSTGHYDDVGFGARHDVVAAVEFLEARRPGRPVIVNGNSMGAAAAAFAARELGHRVRGYILESPYQDLKVAVWNRTELSGHAPLNLAAYAGLTVVSPFFLPISTRSPPSRRSPASPTDVPVLILAGDADRLARPAEARALHGQVASHGRLVFFPGAEHGDLASIHTGALHADHPGILPRNLPFGTKRRGHCFPRFGKMRMSGDAPRGVLPSCRLE